MNAFEAKNLKPGDMVRVIGTRTMLQDMVGETLTVEQVLHGGSYVACSGVWNGVPYRGAVDCRDIVREGV